MASIPPVKRVMTRKEWNEEIVQAINQIVDDNPGCAGSDKLEEVEPKHVWTITDITDAQAILQTICDENTFTELPKYWSAKAVQELKDAIGRGPCGCCEWVLQYFWTDSSGELNFGTVTITSEGDSTVEPGDPDGEHGGPFLGSDYGGWTYIQSGPTECQKGHTPPVGGGPGFVIDNGDCGSCDTDQEDFDDMVAEAWPEDSPYEPPSIGAGGGALDPLVPRE